MKASIGVDDVMEKAVSRYGYFTLYEESHIMCKVILFQNLMVTVPRRLIFTALQ